MSVKNRFIAVIFSIFSILSISLSSVLYAANQPDLNKFQGTWLNDPRSIQSFSLQGIDKHPFNNHNLEGQWTYVFFGFTYCGSLCPTTMNELAKMFRILEKNKINPLPKVVFISIDPDRDTLTKLQKYIQAFHHDFYAVKGEEPMVNKMTRELGVMYEKVVSQSKDKNNYDMQHTGTVILFNPEGKLQAFFTMPHDASVLAKDYQLIVG